MCTWVAHNQQAIFLGPAVSWTAHLMQNWENVLSQATYSLVSSGYLQALCERLDSQASFISGFPGTAWEGKAKGFQ